MSRKDYKRKKIIIEFLFRREFLIISFIAEKMYNKYH